MSKNEMDLASVEVSQDSAVTSLRRPKPLWYWICVGVLLVVIAVTFYPAMTQGSHSPSVADLSPEPIFGKNSPLPFNRLVLARFIMTAIICGVLGFAAAHMKLGPGKGQALVELLVEFVRKSLAIEVLGEERGRRFAPVIGVIFISILGMNLSGVIPGMNIAASAAMAVPLVFAVLSYVTFVGAGIRYQGVGKFFISQLFPPGVPKVFYLLVTPIEIFSTFIVRPVTLAIRILANMISGHMLLTLTYFATSGALAAVGALKVFALASGVLIVVVTLFEVFVAVLQAYIFTILSTVYIHLSIESH